MAQFRIPGPLRRLSDGQMTVTVEAADLGSASVSPNTLLIDNPRSSATSSGVRSDSSPAIVAFTRLIGFCEPRLLERMS